MPQPAITYLEKKWAASVASSDALIRGATQTDERRNIEMLDRDFHRSITPLGRRTLMTVGRWLYWNVSAVRGVINEMAELTVQSYIAQFEGSDQEWGQQVENWMREHNKICDVRGWPFNMGTWQELLIVKTLVDGDIGTIQAENAEGYPMLQGIPSHRIGWTTWSNDQVVQGGVYDGARIIDGTIVDDVGRVLAYRILGEGAPYDYSRYVDIPAKNMFLSFIPRDVDQHRGISELGASVFDWQDSADTRRFELLAQKLNSSLAMIEHNESGQADKSKALINRSASDLSAGKVTTTATETIDGVTVRYFRAGANCKLESPQLDRPTANQQAFRDDVIREALHGMGWSIDYSLKPTQVGGAPMRVVVDRLNRKLAHLRERVLKPAQVRIDGWRVAKVMDNPDRTDKKTVLFPFNPDWWKWGYQEPAVLTADAKYNSDVNIQERRSGNKTLMRAAGENGDYWRDLRAQLSIEAEDLLTRAQALADKFKIKIELALSILQKMDNNPIEAAKEDQPKQPAIPQA